MTEILKVLLIFIRNVQANSNVKFEPCYLLIANKELTWEIMICGQEEIFRCMIVFAAYTTHPSPNKSAQILPA